MFYVQSGILKIHQAFGWPELANGVTCHIGRRIQAHQAFGRPELANGFHGIDATGWQEAARWRKQRRYQCLVGPVLRV